MSEKNGYIPFGDEWKAEIMKLSKAELVEKLSDALSWRNYFKAEWEELKCRTIQ